MSSFPNFNNMGLQSILRNVIVGGNLSTGDITQILTYFISINLPEPPKPIGVPQNIPRSGITKFVGREETLQNLHTQLQGGNLVAISAIAGMGGVGKTELAIQYAKAYKNVYCGGICWLFAREISIGSQITSFAQSQLGLTIPSGLEKLQEQVDWCWRHWKEGDVLVILDDVVNYAFVEPYLPPEDKRFKVLFTTRQKFGPPIQILSLEVLSLEASLELLGILIGAERIQQEQAIAETLCAWLGYLPLGLELVGRYLREVSDLSLATLLFRLKQKAEKRQALQHKALKVGDEETLTSTTKLGVEAAFNLSWDLLDEQSQYLGKLLSLFAAAPIPWGLAERVKQEHCAMYPAVGEFDAEELEVARARLIRFHLLQAVDLQSYRLHSLIREFFRGKLEGESDVAS